MAEAPKTIDYKAQAKAAADSANKTKALLTQLAKVESSAKAAKTELAGESDDE